MGRFEDQTQLTPSMPKCNELSEKRQGQSPRDSEKTKKPVFCSDGCQETSFNLTDFTQTFSSKLILMSLTVKIFWSGLASDTMSLDVFKSRWKMWEIMMIVVVSERLNGLRI